MVTLRLRSLLLVLRGWFGHRRLGPWLTASFALACVGPAQALETVSLQLRWMHQFQFAGYYAALQQGYYAQANLQVTLKEGGPQVDPVADVLAGRSDFGVGVSSLVIDYLKGKPVLMLGPVLQHSPNILLVHGRDQRLVDLALNGTRKIALLGGEQDVELTAMFLNEGISLDKLHIVPNQRHLADFLDRRVDALNAYVSNEPFLLDPLGVPYTVLKPQAYGMDFYGDVLFTRKGLEASQPALVEAFRAATMRGWRYALEHQSEIIDLIMARYNTQNKTRDHLAFEARALYALVNPEVIEVGHNNPGRWQHIANTYERFGLVKANRSLDDFFYQRNHEVDLSRFYWAMLVSICVILLAAGFAVFVYRVNRRLERGLNEKTLSEERHRVIFQTSASPGIVWHDGYVVSDWNQQAEAVFGWRRDEVIGHAFTDFLLPGNEPRQSHPPLLNGTHHNVARNGRAMTCEWFSAWLPERQDQPREVVSLAIDITHRMDSEKKLRLAASVFEHAREGIMISDSAGVIVDVNEAFSRITGYSRADVIGQHPRLLSSGRQDDAFYQAMWRTLSEQGYWRGEVWNRRKSAEVYAEMLTISAVRDASGNAQQYVALFSDITDQKAHQNQLEHTAHYDALTNLPNRVLLADRLHQGMVQAQRRGQKLAVLFLDLDGFKAINDTHGHEAGDHLLVTLSGRMQDVLREGDTLARLGGDEFVAVLMDLEDTTASLPLLQRLLASAALAVSVGELNLQVSASVGITFYPQAQAIDADQLLRQADQAMYQAKLSGKNRYCVFDTLQDHSIRSRHEGLEHIRLALEHREFVLHYQPKVNMHTGKVVGSEALIRWQHPEKGLLAPATFLPLIENHPLAVEVGEWVIDTALHQMAMWRAEGLDLPVSVNVGARQLQQGDFVARLRALLSRHPDVPPGHLALEVLETSALADLALVSQVIEDCAQMGVMFALDDFGTGYSSLTYLKRLHVAMLKIDQSFVRDMLDDPDDLAILQGVIGLANAFKREVIAEGVETVAHGAALLRLGCQLAQGYGIARPMPPDQLPAWATQWQPDTTWVPTRNCQPAP
jgi:diguanylate cyclase (GGDEF)-like protein/PAS domain S-box-containing protein